MSGVRFCDGGEALPTLTLMTVLLSNTTHPSICLQFACKRVSTSRVKARF